ncbi:MAG: tetratricopeptide repeat protein [Oscillospiraceae bacterium]|nr:tetratricopeptide repeat protein [Oscillospiraceae bacterium]
MKKALPYILYSLIILVAAGLLIYQGVVENNLETGDLVKGLLVIIAAIMGMLRPKRRRSMSNKKALYQKAYGDFIQNAFYDDPKLEKKFYKAVDDYNFDRYAAGIDKLTKLRKECQRTADIFAVTVFMALCCDGIQAYEEAVKHYEDAARIRENATLHSNAGLCLMRMGRLEEAEESFHRSLRINEKNAFAWNNLASLYFKQGDYEQALEYAETALEHNAQMPQALGCAAICCGLLDDDEGYRKYYRQAVSAGYDGNKIKNNLAYLNPGIYES